MFPHTKKCLAVAEMSDRLATTDIGRKLGAVLIFGRAGSPSNTMWPGLRPTSELSGILIDAAVWPQKTWAEIGAVPLLFWGEGAGFPSNTMSPGPWPTSILSGNLNPSSRLAIMDVGRKLGGRLCRFWRELGPHLHNVAGAYLHATFHLDPSSRLATIHQRHRQDRQTTV